MTCIITMKDKNNKVWIAGDKLGSNGYNKNLYKDPKVFKVGPFHFGYTTSFYMGQLLKYHWVQPTRNMHIEDDEYIFRDVMNSLKSLFDKNHFGKIKADREPDFGDFLMVYKNRIFKVQYNMSMLEVDDFACVGCGAETAYGVVDALIKHTEYEPEKLLKETMKTVSKFICGVSAECDVLLCKDQ